MVLLLQRGLREEKHGWAGLKEQLFFPTLLDLTSTMSIATFIKYPKLPISTSKAFTSINIKKKFHVRKGLINSFSFLDKCDLQVTF